MLFRSRGIGVAAARLHDELAPKLSDTVELAAGLREIDLSAKPSVDGITLAPPRIGVAKIAGAVENTTPVLPWIPPFKAGHPKTRSLGQHGAKRVIGFEPIHQRINPDADFPQIIPMQLIRINDVGVLALPFEITVESGRRIASAVENAGDVATAVVSSLANDHCDYLTTPEEYSAQFYEGASTIFGPRQLEFMAASARDLAADLAKSGAVADVPAQRHFDFSVHRYYAAPTPVSVGRVLGTARFVEATPDEDAYWSMEWTDVTPGDLNWHEPLVRVEAEQPDGTWTPVADDQGYYVGVTYLGAKAAAHRYEAAWFAPPLGAPGKHRFVLAANASQPETASHPFD